MTFAAADIGEYEGRVPSYSNELQGAVVRLLYAFPEPLPLERARGVQGRAYRRGTGAAGIEVELAYVPNPPLDPLAYYGVEVPAGLS